MTKIEGVLKSVASIFLVVLVTLCIYTFIITDIMKKDYVNVFGYTYFVVASGSMSGAIEVDDIIFVKLTKEVNLNDIITYKGKDGDIITHRLIQKSGQEYITKGDVNNAADETITEDQIIGKVTCSISPSFILKSIAIFLIIFILLALVNFDSIIRKFIIKEKQPQKEVPNDIFRSPDNKKIEPPSGLTITIPLEELENLEKRHEKELAIADEVKVLDTVEYLFEEEDQIEKKKAHLQEKETVEIMVSLLKCKKDQNFKTRMTKKWLEKYQYVYKLCYILLASDTSFFVDEINNPPFQEMYNYDLERVGLTEIVRNRIYHMPLHVFLQLLTYCILYNDSEMFDGVYKILKYKVLVDQENHFKKMTISNKYGIKQLKNQIAFMQKISNNFDNKKVFELDKIERMVKIHNY